MDFARSIQQPNVFHGCEGGGYKLSSQLNSRLRYRSFRCNVIDPSIVLKDRSLKKTRRDSWSSSFVIRGGFRGRLSCSNSCSSLFADSPDAFNLSKRGKFRCQGNDSLAYIDGNDRNIELGEINAESSSIGSNDGAELGGLVENGGEQKEESNSEVLSLDELRELLQKAMTELEVARLNSTMFEEKAQRISEAAIALKDEATDAWNNVNSTLDTVQGIVNEEAVAKEAVQNATMALSLAQARLKVAIESIQGAKGESDTLDGSGDSDVKKDVREDSEALFAAQTDIRDSQINLANCEAELRLLQSKKEELQKEVDRLNEIAEKVQMNALKAEEDVANVMLLAEQAVAFELEATKRVNDAEIALQRAEKLVSSSSVDTLETTQGYVSGDASVVEEEKRSEVRTADDGKGRELSIDGDVLVGASSIDRLSDKTSQSSKEYYLSDDSSDNENGKLILDSPKEAEVEAEKPKVGVQAKRQETQKDMTRESSPKSSLKKSSRFFSASFFSFTVDGAELTAASVFQDLIDSAKNQLPKLILGLLLFGAGVAFYSNRVERGSPMLQQTEIAATSIEEVSSNTKPLIQHITKLPKRIKKLLAMVPHQEINAEEASLFDVLWLLLASVIFVPLFQKIPGGSPVLGYLAAGILIGPYGLSIIRHVHGTKAIAEFGVVFLLFNIGLELSVERLSSMKKYVFGLGSAQVLVTAVAIGLAAHFVCGLPGPAAIVIGNGLALSSTAVVLQVLQERGESTSRHGRATFSVLLFQDLAVVVLLILIPLISPNSSKGGVGFQAIAEALGLAGVKAAIAITAIIAGGRLLLRPIYKQIAENQNAEIFSANTLLVILGTSLLTARAGLSMALGAFLAGLLLAETEFSLQVESDIAPYRGLLLGLFFMTVGMSIDPKLLLSNFPAIMGTLGLLIGGKTLLVALIGRIFGVSIISAIRVGLLLAPGGEFAFVAFGDAVNQGIMSPQLSSLLFLVVGISMALTPWLAAGGQLIASRFEQHDVRSLLPVESETDDLQDHIIICGFGRVGQIIAQLLSERLIPFVALDVRSDRVAVGRALDLPVYFGDAGSREVLHKVGAERACAAAITLDTPGANYRTVWALNKYFPNVKTFVRAHDVDHGINLEKAGATAVVPETLEPSLQLAAAVLAQAKLPMSEIASTINEFRSRHLSELTELCQTSGSSLGYGFSRMNKAKAQVSETSDETQVSEGTLAI
ncbi:K(+) efflux antiporter 2, chloroplastic-like [Euphorbia lathyris]|uniref:K(+) efflux antiporter 2, chloroplastic-like n=1 Tax=Euphorbia lathyris TaxID=212925 RepID=UPI0033142E89